MRYFSSLFILLGVLTISNSAFAYQCISKEGLTTSFNINALYVNPEAKPGTRIGGELNPDPVGQTVLVCDDKSGLTFQGVVMGRYGVNSYVTYEGRYIYPTGIKGIGYAMGVYSPNCADQSTSWHHTLSSGYTTQMMCKRTTNFVYQMAAYPVIQFYKIPDDISHNLNSLPSNMIGYTYGTTSDSGANPRINSILLKIGGLVNSCTVKTKSLTVSLGTVNKSALTTSIAGQTGAASLEPLNFTINCTTAGLPMNILIEPGVTTDEDLRLKGVMNITSNNSSAKGIGIQILRSTTAPAYLGLVTPLGIKTVSGDNHFTLYARYVALKNQTVDAGTANATATFTMSYQ